MQNCIDWTRGRKCRHGLCFAVWNSRRVSIVGLWVLASLGVVVKVTLRFEYSTNFVMVVTILLFFATAFVSTEALISYPKPEVYK